MPEQGKRRGLKRARRDRLATLDRINQSHSIDKYQFLCFRHDGLLILWRDLHYDSLCRRGHDASLNIRPSEWFPVIPCEQNKTTLGSMTSVETAEWGMGEAGIELSELPSR